MKKCETCGGRLTQTRKQEVRMVAGRRFAVTLPAHSCRACGVRVEPSSVERMDLEVACELVREGPVSGETFRFMRRAFGMRALELAELLDVTPETVSRWENEQRLVDRSAWVVLGSMVLEKAGQTSVTLDRLRALKRPRAGARSIRIVVGRSG